MAKVAFIGLGVMGYPMARHLVQRGGHDVAVFNRTEETAERWVKECGGRLARSPREAASDADFAFTCVGTEEDLRLVTLGPDGLASNMKSGAIYIDCTTASASLARELFAAWEIHGVSSLDCPVSGGQEGAERANLIAMVGGSLDAYLRAQPLIHCFATFSTHMGDSGAGQLTKMVSQICITGVIQGLAEGIHFAKRSGLDAERALKLLSRGAASSWQMKNRHKSMIESEFEFGFAVDLARKDLRIALGEARTNGSQLPITALIDHFYATIQANGHGHWDTSSLITLLDVQA